MGEITFTITNEEDKNIYNVKIWDSITSKEREITLNNYPEILDILDEELALLFSF